MNDSEEAIAPSPYSGLVTEQEREAAVEAEKHEVLDPAFIDYDEAIASYEARPDTETRADKAARERGVVPQGVVTGLVTSGNMNAE